MLVQQTVLYSGLLKFPDGKFPVEIAPFKIAKRFY